MNDRLKITIVEQKTPASVPGRKGARREEIQAKMERLWLQDPSQFDPERDCVQRQRIQKTSEILNQLSLPNKLTVDLGCGSGFLAERMRDGGARVTAVDAANLALQKLKEKKLQDITPVQDCLPATRLGDEAYDIVLCTEVIGFLNPDEYRMAFSEMSRLVKAEGQVVCSTALDIHSDDSLERFAALAETEFNIDRWLFSYHRLWLRLCHFYEAPAHFIRASQDREYYLEQIKSKKGIGRWWLEWNATTGMAWIWKGVNIVVTPLAKLLRQNASLMVFLEKVCKFLSGPAGISHALFVGHRRPLAFPLPPSKIPQEIKHKRQVWE